MKYYLIAGEASGDLHASHLIKEIKKNDTNAKFRFFGGDLMQAEGGTLVKHYREMAYMGFIPVLMNLKKVLRNMKECREDLLSFNPDVLILVDYPGFNLKIAKFAKQKLNIPIYYYISPKIWAWKEYRIKKIKKYIDKIYSILPFEVDFYHKHNYQINYVGNPTVDELSIRDHQEETFEQFVHENKLKNKPIIAILAGSRRSEIANCLPTMIDAASHFPQYQLVIAGAPGIEHSFYRGFATHVNVSIVFDKTYRLLQQSTAALVTSGTATLEAGLLNVPQVVCYRVFGGRFTYTLFHKILKVPHVSLVNLITGKEVVPEMLQHHFTEKQVEQKLKEILENESIRNEMKEGYLSMRTLLGQSGAPQRAAKDMVASLQKKIEF